MDRLSDLAKLDVSHFGFSVPDVDKAVEQWSSIFGAGPFYLFEAGVTFQLTDLTFRGRPFEFVRHPAAYGCFGGTKVELGAYEVVCDDPELNDVFNPGSGGVNHVAVFADDPLELSEHLGGIGVPRIIEGRAGDRPWLWHDARSALGYCIEIIGDTRAVRDFESAMVLAAADWDGRDRLRRELPVPFA